MSASQLTFWSVKTDRKLNAASLAPKLTLFFGTVTYEKARKSRCTGMSGSGTPDLDSGKPPPRLQRRWPWRSLRRRESPRRRSYDSPSPSSELTVAKERSAKPRRTKSFRERTSRALHALVGRGPPGSRSGSRQVSSDTSRQEETSRQERGRGRGTVDDRAKDDRGQDMAASPASSDVSSSVLSSAPTSEASRPPSRSQTLSSSTISPHESPVPSRKRDRAFTESAQALAKKWIFPKTSKQDKPLCFWSPSEEVSWSAIGVFSLFRFRTRSHVTEHQTTSDCRLVIRQCGRESDVVVKF